MRKLVLNTYDYNDIPWYMHDAELYIIEEVPYNDEYDTVLAGTTEYFVYLKEE